MASRSRKSPNTTSAPSSWSRFDRASSRWASARTWRPRARNSSTVAPPVNPVAAGTKAFPWLMPDLPGNYLDVDRHLNHRRVQLDVNRNRRISGSSAVEEMRSDEKVEKRSREDTGADCDGGRGGIPPAWDRRDRTGRSHEGRRADARGFLPAFRIEGSAGRRSLLGRGRHDERESGLQRFTRAGAERPGGGGGRLPLDGAPGQPPRRLPAGRARERNGAGRHADAGRRNGRVLETGRCPRRRGCWWLAGRGEKAGDGRRLDPDRGADGLTCRDRPGPLGRHPPERGRQHHGLGKGREEGQKERLTR